MGSLSMYNYNLHSKAAAIQLYYSIKWSWGLAQLLGSPNIAFCCLQIVLEFSNTLIFKQEVAFFPLPPFIKVIIVVSVAKAMFFLSNGALKLVSPFLKIKVEGSIP